MCGQCVRCVPYEALCAPSTVRFKFLSKAFLNSRTSMFCVMMNDGEAVMMRWKRYTV